MLFRSSVFRGLTYKLALPFLNGDYRHPAEKFCGLRKMSSFLQISTFASALPSPGCTLFSVSAHFPILEFLLQLRIPDALSQIGELWFSKFGPRPATPAWTGNLLEMQILQPHPRPTESEILEWVLGICSNRPCRLLDSGSSLSPSALVRMQLHEPERTCV